MFSSGPFILKFLVVIKFCLFSVSSWIGNQRRPVTSPPFSAEILKPYHMGGEGTMEQKWYQVLVGEAPGPGVAHHSGKSVPSIFHLL